MTWIKTDDAHPMHAKMLRLSDGAYRLWQHGLAHCNRIVTDGVISKDLIPTLNHHGAWSKKQISGFISELLDYKPPHKCGLWIEEADHYRVYNYEHHQAEAMSDRVDRKRAHDRERKRESRARSDNRAANVQGGHRLESDATPHGIQPESLVPTRPDPSRPTERETVGVPETVSFEAHVQAEYVSRFKLALPGKPLPMAARGLPGMGHTVWGELARIASDAAGCSALFDAAFADSFVVGAGYTPNAIKGSADRLLAVGARNADGSHQKPAGGVQTVSPVLGAIEDIESRLRAARALAHDLAGEDGVTEARAKVESIRAELRAANAMRDRGAA